MTDQQKADEWKLDEIKLSFNRWGEDKGKYTGTIEFRNGEPESFKFKIRPGMAQAYIDLISSDIVRCARNLGDRLIKSLGLEENND